MNQSLARFDFPTNFSLSVNKEHYSNEEESMKFIKKILVPYIECEQKWLISFRSAEETQYLVRLYSSHHDIDFPTARPYCEWVHQEVL